MPKLGMEPIRKAALVKATITEIGRVGSLDVTVSQIAKRAGMSEPRSPRGAEEEQTERSTPGEEGPANKKKGEALETYCVNLNKKARDGKLGIEEMTGGTFSISNGGTFGSMMSTPIINPPQSAILGVHATKDRAMVENGQVVVRPMNYFAMSYDHRIIDGREAVLGLVAMKEALEDPARLLFDI